MRLDSVRALKTELVDELRSGLARLSSTKGGRLIETLALEARPLTSVRGAPTLAIGVAPNTVRKGDYRLAVRLQRRSAAGALEASEFAKRARGEIDVRYVGRIHKRTWFTDRHRPVQIGLSIGHVRITAGTLGAFVRDRKGRLAILSNNHVLADENRGTAGDAILQPGAIDHGARGDRVAGLLRFVALRGGGTRNAVDAAIATVDDGIETDVDALYRSRSRFGGLAPPDALVDRVEKWGRTTGHTRGRVTAFELDNVVVGYDMGHVRFDGQVEIESSGRSPFSQGGDSGSVILTTDEHRAVALLFAGSQTGGRANLGLTYANPMDAVLTSLRVQLLP